MKRVYLHIVPVGRSLLESFASSNISRTLVGALQPKTVREELDAARHDGTLALEPLLHEDKTRAAEATRELARLAPPRSAELSTLDAFQRKDNRADASGDTTVLAATDTNDGLRAAALLAHLLATRAGTQVRYTHDPLAESVPLPLPEGGVLLVRIPELNLDPTRLTKVPPPQTWRALGELARVVANVTCDSDVERHVEFHLTGGYKATLPYLLVAADAVQTVVRKRLGGGVRRVRATVLHEENKEPVELPVRWLTGGHLDKLQDLTQEIEAPARLTQDSYADLRGTYLRDGEIPELTETGLITTRALWALRDPRL